MDARTAAMTAAHEVLRLVADERPRSAAVRVTAGGVRVCVRVVEVRPRRHDPATNPTRCERDILTLLRGAWPAPWTTGRVLSEMAARPAMLHGETTVRVALSALVKAGLITSSRKAPRGYRLACTAVSPSAIHAPRGGIEP